MTLGLVLLSHLIIYVKPLHKLLFINIEQFPKLAFLKVFRIIIVKITYFFVV